MIVMGTIKVKYNEELGLMGPFPYIDEYGVEPFYAAAAPTYEELRQILKNLGITLCKKENIKRTRTKNIYRCQAKIDASIKVETVDEDGGEYWTLNPSPFYAPCPLYGATYEELRANAKKYMNMNLPEERDIHMVQNGNGFSYFDIWE